MGGVEEPCPVWEVGFLLLVSVQRGLCFSYCHFMFLSVLIVGFLFGLIARALDSCLCLGTVDYQLGYLAVLAPPPAGSLVTPFHLAALGFGLGTRGEVLLVESTPPDYHRPGSVGYSQRCCEEGT